MNPTPTNEPTLDECLERIINDVFTAGRLYGQGPVPADDWFRETRSPVQALKNLITQVVEQVIGEDDLSNPDLAPSINLQRNRLRFEQRARLSQLKGGGDGR